jgi:small-conductance mechanosensitive channel
MPDWAFGLVMIAVGLGAAFLAYELLVIAVRRGVRRRSDFTRSLLLRTRSPARFALVIGALSGAAHVAPLPDNLERLLQHGLLIAFIVLVGWIAMTALDIGTAIYLRSHRTDVADNLHARKMLTQTRILRRSLNALVLLLTAAAVLMSIPGVKQFGVSLLAAGGAAGIIVGLALQPVLSNLLAGIQIAFTQPIRIDDAVVIQNQFGHVEEINSTFVVIRLRDLRRMVVPLKFFLEQPFENWTRESSALDAEVLFLVDQRVPVAELRGAIQQVARASAHWGQGMLTVDVNDIRERSMEIRCRLGARNAAEAGALKAEVREQVITWLQANYPGALPRNGVEEVAGEAEIAPAPPADTTKT